VRYNRLKFDTYHKSQGFFATVLLLIIIIFAVIPLEAKEAGESIPHNGQPVNCFDLIQWDGVNISLYGDTTENLTNDFMTSGLQNPVLWMNESTIHHHQVGAGSITRSPDNGTWYIIVRERINNAIRGRGYAAYMCNSSENLTKPSGWVLLWRANRTNVSNPPGELHSVERSCLRYYNGSYYWYFCTPVDNATDWKIYYVKTLTIERLGNQWIDGNNWIAISTGVYYRLKDPWIGFDGTNYILWVGKSTSVSSRGMAIFTADNPEFTNKTEQWSTPNQETGNTGFILYNNMSGGYVAWSGILTGSDSDWYFYTGDTIANLTLREQWDLGIDNRSKGNYRYMDYYKINETSWVVVMEYDWDNQNNSNEFVVFYYNNPKNNETTITTEELQEAVNCWVNDIPMDGHLVTTPDLQAMIYLWLNS